MAAKSDVSGGKLRKSKSGLKIDSDDLSPFLLEEPNWTPDSESLHCSICNKSFDFFTRRHHCRRCGKLYCGNDCNVKISLPRFSFVDPVRVCESCAIITRKENEFFEKHLKTLCIGGNFQVTSSTKPAETEPLIFTCRVTKNHKFVEFDGKSTAHDNIAISSINKAQVKATNNEAGKSVANGATIVYKDFHGNQQTVNLTVCADSKRKQSMAWLAAFQKGMKMIFD